jgi:oligopeptidase B
MTKPSRSDVIWAVAMLVIALTASPWCARREARRPPLAAVKPEVDTLFGDVRSDDYFWLRDRSNPEVRRYLEAENDYTEAIMRPTRRIQERLFEEFKARIVEADTSEPVRKGDYWYYTRFEAGRGYPIYCRRQCHPEASEEILLDQNTLAGRLPYCEIGASGPVRITAGWPTRSIPPEWRSTPFS